MEEKTVRTRMSKPLIEKYTLKHHAQIDITLPFVHKGGRPSTVAQFIPEIAARIEAAPTTTMTQHAANLQLEYLHSLPSPSEETTDTLQGPSLPRPPTRSGLSKAIRKGAFQKQGFPYYTFKKVSKRGVDSNSETNKALRIERITALYNAEAAGKTVVYVDETSFEIGTLGPSRGYSETGTPVYSYTNSRGTRFSILSAILTNGVSYCLVVTGSVDTEVFNGYIDILLSKLVGSGSIVFWMDNALIHNGVRAQLEGLDHSVIFNAPYSPELNPIEKIFGVLKNKVRATGRNTTDRGEFLRFINEVLDDIHPDVVRRTILSTRTDVWQQVLNNDDI